MERVNILQQADIFYELPREHLEKLVAICHQVICKKAGDVIVEQSSPSDELYVIVRGKVDIVLDPNIEGVDVPESPDPVVIATLLPGETFGEVGLVDRGLRSASACAAAPNTELLAIKRDDLLRLCQKDYHLGFLIMRNIASGLAFKIRNTDFRVREQLFWQPRPK
jgi:CRP/FNR family cyclic AMP-dependent transcriptional regulator